MKGIAKRQKDPVRDDSLKAVQFTVGELAEAAGIHATNIKRLCRRLEEQGKRPVDNKKKGKCPINSDDHVTDQVVNLIMNPRGIPRSPIRPPGWLTVKVVKDKLKASKNTIYRLIHTGELKARNYKGTLYIDPEDARRLELQRRYEKPLIGWELVAGVCNEAGRTQQALDAWIKRHKVPIRFYLHPSMNKIARFMPTGAAQAYRALAGKTGKYTPKARLNPSLLEPIPTPMLDLGATRPAWGDVTRPATHAEEQHPQQVFSTKEASLEEIPHPDHDGDRPRGLPHHHRVHAGRGAFGGHHADRRPRGPTQPGAG